MMNRQASLRTAALELRTRLFRGLPWGSRVAHVFMVLGSGTARAFEQGLVSLIRKERPDLMGDVEATALLHGVGKNNLMKAFRVTKNMEDAEDILTEVLIKITQSPEKFLGRVDSHVTLSWALNIITRTVHNLAINHVKSVAQSRHDSLFDTDEDDERRHRTVPDLDDPRALAEFEELLSATELREIKRDLAKILPWAPSYLDMLLEGYDDKEIIGDIDHGRPSLLAKKLRLDNLMSPTGKPMTMGMWSKPNGWKSKIRDVIDQHVRN